MQFWTEEEKTKLKQYAQEGKNAQEIAKLLGRSYESTRKALIRPNITNKVEGTKHSDIINLLKEELKKAQPYKKNETISTGVKGDTLMVHFTDWHIGRIIKDEQGKTIYDEVAFKERIKFLMGEILTLLDDYIKKGTPIKDVVIMSTGDIVDGSGIFATQNAFSELSPPFQVMLAVETIQGFILALLKRKLQIKFYGVKGNHGEIREGGKNKDPNANWDLMVYLILDLWVRNMLKDSSAEIHYSELDYFNFEVQGWKYHIRHIAPNQSETAAGKGKFLGWARKHEFDCLVYGHYHHWGIWDRSGITVFRGGSVPGADEFSESLAEDSQPIQLIWGVSKGRPLTFSYAVDVGRKG